jgi:hypothetical protein
VAEKFKIGKVLYRVTLSDDATEAVVTPVVEIHTEEPLSLLACLSVDSLELLPSARVSAAPGGGAVEIKSVRLRRPEKSFPGGFRKPASYMMELRISHDGVSFVSSTEELVICGK